MLDAIHAAIGGPEPDDRQATITFDTAGVFQLVLHTHGPDEPCPQGLDAEPHASPANLAAAFDAGQDDPAAETSSGVYASDPENGPPGWAAGQVVRLIATGTTDMTELPPDDVPAGAVGWVHLDGTVSEAELPDPSYCQGCGTIWHSRRPSARCPICGQEQPGAATPSSPAQGIIQWSRTDGGEVPPDPAFAAPTDPHGNTYPPYDTEHGLATLLAWMNCGDPAETARAFTARHTAGMLYGQPAHQAIFHAGAALTSQQPVMRQPDPDGTGGGIVVPWDGSGAAPFGAALVSAAPGEAVIVAVLDPDYHVPDVFTPAEPTGWNAARRVTCTAAEPVRAGMALEGEPGDGPGVVPYTGRHAAPFGIALADAEPGQPVLVILPGPGLEVFPPPRARPDGPDGHGEYPEPHTCDAPGCPCGAARRADEADEVARDAYARGEDSFTANAEYRRRPGPLDSLPGDTVVLMAPVPGPAYYAWRHVALGVWIAPAGERTADVADDDEARAEHITVAELRQLLQDRGEKPR
jgi:hypothetical protein